MKKPIALLLPFALLASFAFAGVPGSQASAPTTPNKVVDFETIAGALNADGSLARVRLLDDLRVYGTGDVTVTDPDSTNGLRNLLGFSGPTAVGNNLVRYEVANLNGSKQFLTVSTPDRNPPLAMSVGYTLNGHSITGPDLVGKSGDVGLTFTVKNTTSRTQDVTYQDSAGKKLTAQMQVPLPIVAQLQVTLPPNHFTSVTAPGADVVTDPFGDKIVNWSFVLVPPIGELTQTATLLAHVDAFKLGPVQLAGAPVAPKNRTYLDFAENQFANGSQQAGSLFSGANQIADKMNSLHDGTLQLLGGVQKLYEGAQQLTAGLQAAIAPTGKLLNGFGSLGGGVNGLIGGLNKVKNGIPSGEKKLTSGVSGLDAGLAAMQDCLTGTGKLKCQGHAIAGTTSAAIIPQLELGLNACLASVIAGICQGNDSVTLIAQKLKAATDACLTGVGATVCNGVSPSVATLAALAAATPACSGDVTTACQTYVGGIAAIAPALQSGADLALDGIPQLINGLLNGGGGSAGIIGGLQGIAQIAQGLSAGIGSGTSADIAFCSNHPSKCSSIRGGLGAIVQGVVGGFKQLLAGLGSSSASAVQSCLANAKTCTLLSGAGAVANGLGQLKTGLVGGLQQAVSGSGLIATCLGAPGTACQGNPSLKGGISQVEQGVYAINELGVKEVGRQANDTQVNIGQQLGLMQAEDARAQTGSLLYGPPSSDQARTVIGGSSVVLTMDALDGRKSQNETRGIYAAIALLLLLGLGLIGMRGMRRAAA